MTQKVAPGPNYNWQPPRYYRRRNHRAHMWTAIYRRLQKKAEMLLINEYRRYGEVYTDQKQFAGYKKALRTARKALHARHRASHLWKMLDPNV